MLKKVIVILNSNILYCPIYINRCIVLLNILFVYSFSGFCQLTNSGKDFWFGFPENLDKSSATYSVYIASKYNTSGTISIPGQGYSQNFSVSANSSVSVVLPTASVLVLGSDTIENKAIHVTAANDVTVYCQASIKFRNDASLVLPVSILGSDYYVLSYKGNNTTTNPSEFMVIGENKPITVEITPSDTCIGGKLPGVPFNITLNPGEVYQLQSAAGDLTGSRIRAVNGIDVFGVIGAGVFSRVPNVGCSGTADPLIEQLYPVNFWGKEYVFIPTPLLNDDVCRVLASQNATNITVNGTYVATLNTGQFYEFSINSPTFISADKPISVGKYIKTGGCVAQPIKPSSTSNLSLGDPAMAVINPNEQMYLDTINFFASVKQTIDSIFVTVVTRTTDVNLVNLNGTSISSSFSSVPSNTFYSYATLKIDSGFNSLTTTGCGILAYVTGLGLAESYCYSAGVRSPILSETQIVAQQSACKSDTVQLTYSSTGSPLSWQWNFGDGNTSIQPNPKHVYADTGTYVVTLVTTYKCFTDTVKDTIYISNCNGTMIVTVNSDTICGGECSTLSVNVSGVSGPFYYKWSSLPDTMAVVSVCLQNTTTYTITVTNNSGDSATANAQVYVYQPVVVNAGSDTSVCYGNGVSFSGSGGSFYQWSTGDTTPSITVYPSQNTTYYLTVTSNNNCSSIDSVTANVNPLPQAFYTYQQSCADTFVQFFDSSLFNGTQINSWNWNFGDGSGATLQNPSHSYNSTGNYTVSLVVTTTEGCKDTVMSQINLLSSGTVNFNVNNVCFGDTAYFNNTSTLNANGVTYNWNFGDGDSSALQTPSHAYQSDGAFNVTLVAITDSGCNYSANKTIWVNPIPVSAFTVQHNCVFDTVFFNNTSTINSGSISSILWDFGNGNSSAAYNSFEVYQIAGTYTATLTLQSDSGCIDSSFAIVNVYYLPSASFEFTTTCEGDSTYFEDKSTITIGNINNWIWDFGDGSSFNYTQNLAHLYSIGQYDVLLIVVSDMGCMDTITKMININPLPLASFTNKNNCFNEQPVLFTNSSSIAAGSLSGWNWDFGDGVSSTDKNPWHVYSTYGDYNVVLSIVSDSGCKDTVTQILSIHPIPDIQFAADLTAGCIPLCVNFSNSTSIPSGTITSWNWDLGDGAVSTEENPANCYNSDGEYTIKLTALSDKGCKNTMEKNNYISAWPLPNADFTYSPLTPSTYDFDINMTDLSYDNITNWSWLFFDTDTSNLIGLSDIQNPSFNIENFSTTINGEKYFIAQLIVSNLFGCRDTVFKKIRYTDELSVTVPNAFTPNGDGKNDYFFPTGIGFYPDKEFDLQIFNRWGDLIFESHSLSDPWDGTARSLGGKEIIQQGVYVWVLQIQPYNAENDAQKYIGSVTLIK